MVINSDREIVVTEGWLSTFELTTDSRSQNVLFQAINYGDFEFVTTIFGKFVRCYELSIPKSEQRLCC